ERHTKTSIGEVGHEYLKKRRGHKKDGFLREKTPGKHPELQLVLQSQASDSLMDLTILPELTSSILIAATFTQQHPYPYCSKAFCQAAAWSTR
ncbi:hypothetical protein STEG23_017194, partial [Scotinomys teguina]